MLVYYRAEYPLDDIGGSVWLIIRTQLPELKLDINSHKISLLTQYQISYFTVFMKHIPGKVERGILRNYIQAIRDLSKILIIVDNESYQLRYHIDKNKMTCFDGSFQINCKELLENYYKYLDLGGIIWAFTDYFPDPE